MSKNEKYFKNKPNRITRNYDGTPILEGYVMVPTPFDEVDCEANCTNSECIIMVPKAGRYFKTMYKAVPAAQEKMAKASYNSWQNDILGPRRDGRCMIPVIDPKTGKTVLKECPRKKGNNHPECKDCPHRDKYEKRNKSFVSTDHLMDVYEMAIEDPYTGKELEDSHCGDMPAGSASPLTVLIAKENHDESRARVANMYEELILKSPKHGLAMVLMGLGYKGKEFEQMMQLSHDAANTVRQQVDNMAAKGIHRISQIDLDTLSIRNNKRNDYYREEAHKALDILLDMFF